MITERIDNAPRRLVCSHVIMTLDVQTYGRKYMSSIYGRDRGQSLSIYFFVEIVENKFLFSLHLKSQNQEFIFNSGKSIFFYPTSPILKFI